MMKTNFLNYSIQKKFNVTLLLLVILPIVLFGVGMVVWIYREDTRELYDTCFQNLADGISDLEDCYAKIDDIRLECMVQNAVRRIMENRAADKDYVEARQWLDEIYSRTSLYENICITLNNGKQLQAGNYIHENIDTIKLFTQEEGSYWKLGEEVEYMLNRRNPYNGDIISYTACITDSTDIKKSIGLLSIKIKETEIANLCERQLPMWCEDVFLVTTEGQVVSSTDKSKINQIYENHGQIYFPEKSLQNTCFYRGTVLLCRYSEVINCYLVYEIPANFFFRSIFLIIGMVLIAIGMCIIFSIIFGVLQKKYIIRPIYAIVRAFGEVVQGELQTFSFEMRGDEIGVLQSSLNQMIERLDTMIKQVYKAQIEKKEAELRVLSEQINPHFLYNTLDSIHWKAICNKDKEVADQILALSDIYRYLLNSGKDFIRIKDEVCFLEKYLYLIRARFGERVCWTSDIDPAVLDVEIPKLIIQPLLENAIHHGLEPQIEGGRIRLVIRWDRDNLNIVVEDTGIGFGKDLFLKNEEISELENGVALRNIYNRLNLYYSGRFEYTIQSSEYGGSKVIIIIYIKEDARDEDVNSR